MRTTMLLLLLTSVLVACARSAGDPAADDALTPASTDEEIMLHMVRIADSQGQTAALAQHFPDLDRERAYAVQRLRPEDPLAALVWAANELPKWGMHLKAGEFVLSGTVCPPLPVRAGDSAIVSFTSLGSVSAAFVD